ncbi:hypothetical protein RIF29_39726 [Crotalaria pallida]|uniref:Uncharacterized protein n=1 Tax=Crotalaria pallida TaxID=3830 RepID=A0AAN9E830_CROPI
MNETMNQKDANSEIPGMEVHDSASKSRTEKDMVISDEASGKAKNQEDIPNYGKKDLENHFGPWMLVRKPNRRKDFIRNSNASNSVTASHFNGNNKKSGPTMMRSRFAALEQDTEEKNVDDNVNNEASDNAIEEEKIEQNKMGLNAKNKQVAQRTEKVRNPLGGKKPQHKGGRPIMGQPNNKKPSSSGLSEEKKSAIVDGKISVSSGENPVESSNRVLGKDSGKDTKVQDEENRRRMNQFQQVYNYKGDNLMTHVVLPSQEVVELVKQKAEMFKQHFTKDEPPDRGLPEETAGHEVDNVTMDTDSSVAAVKAQGRAVDSCVGSGLEPSSRNQV